MARSVSFEAPSLAGVGATSLLSTWRIPVEVITPIFGGGTQKGSINTVTPISSKSIRGHLRQWWRLVVFPQLAPQVEQPDLVTLKALREEEVFGSLTWRSPFDLRVIDVTPAPSRTREAGETRTYGYAQGGPELYALFPATGVKKPQRPPPLWREGLKFVLEVKWRRDRTPALSDRRHEQREIAPFDHGEIERQLGLAISAWLAMGGVGSRTRRGLGAVSFNSEELSPKGWTPAEVWWNLPDPWIVLRPLASVVPLTAWSHALRVYRDFRQQREPTVTSPKAVLFKSQGYVGAKMQPSFAGRSKWPEPDSIRTLTGSHLKAGPHTIHDTAYLFRPHPPASDQVAFPRAALGLPIIFHFADGPEYSASLGIPAKDRDPADVELRPVGATRMASPVITRPIRVDRKWHAGIVVMDHTHTSGLRAELASAGSGAMVQPTGVVAAIPTDQIAGLDLATRPPLLKRTNAIDALVEFAKGAGFTPIGPQL